MAAGRRQVLARERVVPAGLACVGPGRDRHHHARERRRRPAAALGGVIDVGRQRVIDLQAIADHAPREGRRHGLRLGLTRHRRACAPEVVDRVVAGGIALDPDGKSLHHRERAVWAVRLPAWRGRRRGAVDLRGGIETKVGHQDSRVSIESDSGGTGGEAWRAATWPVGPRVLCVAGAFGRRRAHQLEHVVGHRDGDRRGLLEASRCPAPRRRGCDRPPSARRTASRAPGCGSRCSTARPPPCHGKSRSPPATRRSAHITCRRRPRRRPR